MDKHAYMLIVHKLDCTFQTLLMLLDDKRNDIFIHVDKKTGEFDEEIFKSSINYANIIFVKDRINVNWGGIHR